MVRHCRWFEMYELSLKWLAWKSTRFTVHGDGYTEKKKKREYGRGGGGEKKRENTITFRFAQKPQHQVVMAAEHYAQRGGRGRDRKGVTVIELRRIESGREIRKFADHRQVESSTSLGLLEGP